MAQNLKSIVTSVISNLKLLDSFEKFKVTDLILPVVWNKLTKEEQDYVVNEFYDMYQYATNDEYSVYVTTEYVFENVFGDSRNFYEKYFRDVIDKSYEAALKGDKGIFIFQEIFCKVHGKEWHEYSNYEKGLMNKMFYNHIQSDSWMVPKVSRPRIKFRGFNSQCKHEYIKVIQ